MRHGILIPASVVRFAVGAVVAMVVAIVLAEAPEAWRYYKIEKM